MVKNPHILAQFEKEYIQNDNRSFDEKLKSYDALYNYAVKLGILPSGNPLEGIETKIKVAKIINGIK